MLPSLHSLTRPPVSLRILRRHREREQQGGRPSPSTVVDHLCFDSDDHRSEAPVPPHPAHAFPPFSAHQGEHTTPRRSAVARLAAAQTLASRAGRTCMRRRMKIRRMHASRQLARAPAWPSTSAPFKSAAPARRGWSWATQRQISSDLGRTASPGPFSFPV
jgi:hypothetical protein